MAGSTQHKLDRIRPPRVQITYDVEIGGALQMKELPFVGGVLADLSGIPEAALPKLKDRKFVNIDRDNFNDVMAAVGPRLTLLPDNKLKNSGSKLQVELKFNRLDDFNPVSIIKQVEPLRKLLEARQRLSDLLAKLDGNDELTDLLQDVVSSTESLEELKTLCAGTTRGEALAPPPAAAAPSAIAEAGGAKTESGEGAAAAAEKASDTIAPAVPAAETGNDIAQEVSAPAAPEAAQPGTESEPGVEAAPSAEPAPDAEQAPPAPEGEPPSSKKKKKSGGK